MRRRRGSSNKYQNVLFDVNPDVLTASKMRQAWRQLSKAVTPSPLTFTVPPGIAVVVAQWAGIDFETGVGGKFPQHVLKTVYQDSYSTVPCGEWAPQYSGASSGVCLTCGHSYPSHLQQKIKTVHDEVIMVSDLDMAEIEAKVIADLMDDTPFWAGTNDKSD